MKRVLSLTMMLFAAFPAWASPTEMLCRDEYQVRELQVLDGVWPECKEGLNLLARLRSADGTDETLCGGGQLDQVSKGGVLLWSKAGGAPEVLIDPRGAGSHPTVMFRSKAMTCVLR